MQQDSVFDNYIYASIDSYINGCFREIHAFGTYARIHDFCVICDNDTYCDESKARIFDSGMVFVTSWKRSWPAVVYRFHEDRS